MKSLQLDLLNQPMDRAQFLKLLLLAVLAIVGVTRLLEALPEARSSSQTTSFEDSAGYGGTSYGR